MTLPEQIFIVVIDDEPGVLDVLKMFLEKEGFDVLAASSLEHAIARLGEQGRTPDIVIADYRLAGGMVGTDAIRMIQDNADRLIPGILITGDTAPHRIQETQARGIRILHKPLRTDALRTVISQVLEQARPYSSGSPSATMVSPKL